MPALSDAMGSKLVNILEMMARETLRSRLRNSEQTKKEYLGACAAQEDISRASKLDWTMTAFKSRAGAELMLRDLKRLQPDLFEDARVEGHYLIRPDLPVVDKAIAEISRDRSIVAVALKEPEEEPYLRSVDEGDVSKILVGDEHAYRDALNAQYFSTILEDNDIDVHVEKNAIVIPHDDLKAAESVLEKENERLVAMGPERAEQFLRSRFKDRLGVEFDSDMRVAEPAKDMQNEKAPDPDKAPDPAKVREEWNEAERGEGMAELSPAQACLKEHGIESDATFCLPGVDFNVNGRDLEEAKSVLKENGFDTEAVSIGVDNSLPAKNAEKEETEQAAKVNETEKSGPEQTPEIEAEEVAEKTVDGVSAPGEDADAALSRETRKAELHEDIANVKTTADCVQARPDANNTDISTPYADGQDAPGTGDTDGDGITDSAEDRDGDGTPDEWDADSAPNGNTEWDGKSEFIDDDPDYEPVSMKERSCDELLMDKEAEAKFVESREAARGEKDVSLQTEAR